MCIRIAFKTFQNVLGLQAQLGGTFGGGDGANPAATQQDHFFTCWYSSLELRSKSVIDAHAGSLLPCYGDCTGHKADPFTLGISAPIDQHSVARLPPSARHLR